MVVPREYTAGFVLLLAILTPIVFGLDNPPNDRIVTNVFSTQLAFERHVGLHGGVKSSSPNTSTER